MTHNILQVDGKGIANHINMILEINAIQWVQGMRADMPIMQWVPLIKINQAAGKSIVVDLQVSELESFMKEVNPKGIFFVLKLIKKYKKR